MIDDDARRLMALLDTAPFAAIVDFCGSDDNPGLGDIPERQVWTDWGTTPDQAQIEEVLDPVVGRASTIFHVGVGNSSLAQRFARRILAIDGITVAAEEKYLADSLNYQNYHVQVVNKYSREFASRNDRYDVIVDNNPSSFACCRFHFCRMMVNYVKMLRDGGAIFTAQAGLNWVTPGGDPAWSLRWEDWVFLGKVLAMPVRQLSPTVYCLIRPAPLKSAGARDCETIADGVAAAVDGPPAGNAAARRQRVEWSDQVMKDSGWCDHERFNQECDAAFAQLRPMTPIREFTDKVPTVVCVVRNEERRLPDFIRHYKKLGVSALHIIDNASTDRTPEICARDSSITMWRTDASYAAAAYGQVWVGALARKYGIGKWVLNVDADELFVYSDMHFHHIGELQKWAMAQGNRRVFAPMIDMYGSRNYGAGAQPDHRPLLLQNPFFDGNPDSTYRSYEFRDTPYGPLLVGGPRNRILAADRKKIYLSKFPLSLWTTETAYANPHFPYPFRDNPSMPYAALLHFKFLSDFAERVATAVVEGEHWHEATEYREYQRWLRQGGGHATMFSTQYSRTYHGPTSLVEAGLMRLIEWQSGASGCIEGSDRRPSPRPANLQG
jgi:glycosyltransferase involved in cell wall biosynthesis